MKNGICFTIAIVLIFSQSCNVLTGTGNPNTEQGNDQGNNPWMVTATDCDAPNFGELLDPNSNFAENGFKYFQGMWQEAKALSKNNLNTL